MSVAAELLSELLKAVPPAGWEQHHELVQLLCDNGGVTQAAAHLRQMSTDFGVVPRARDFCVVQKAALQLPASEWKRRLLRSVARNTHFAALFLSAGPDGLRHVALSRYSTEEEALDTVRALLLWLPYASRRAVLYEGDDQRDDGLTMQLLAADEQHSSGLCERVKALLATRQPVPPSLSRWHGGGWMRRGSSWAVHGSCPCRRRMCERCEGRHGRRPAFAQLTSEWSSGRRSCRRTGSRRRGSLPRAAQRMINRHQLRETLMLSLRIVCCASSALADNLLNSRLIDTIEH